MVKKIKKLKGLGLQVIPFSEVQELSISQRVKKILNIVLGNRIVILHGRLRPEEEARLIEDTMALVDHVKNFKGIELAVIEPNPRSMGFFLKMKHGIARKLVGNNTALTIIGPATVIKEIKRDPKKLELMLR
ncbi:MAG: DUF2073 domain-containing protein [Nanoarchaeota archaeon]|nr:DUF2073 domain-containing protein [Nanoarchaeota archaeon]MBU1051961.1 DUF2073 domain-containing protein [Nanoarchaeota archaeon]MBU1988301.1 DUF2073 domain-containing protein [Nanoarchaeota archaeon]